MAQLIERYEDFASTNGVAICLGNFDGVHLGHQKLLQTCLDVAKRQRLASMIFTFKPHPMKVLRPASAPKLLMTYEERREFLNQMGFDFILEQEFTKEFATISAEKFTKEILSQTLCAKEIIVGDNFTFGHMAKGNMALLKASSDFHTTPVDVLTKENAPINSTRIRKDIAEGRIESANVLLGREYFLRGEVVEGKKLGAQLGFPTANLRTAREALPKNGIYFCRAKIFRSEVSFPAAVSIGTNPSILDADSSIKIEAYLLDFSENLYGQQLQLEFLKRHRDEMKFSNLEELKTAIAADVLELRKFFKAN
ncbi:MAG: bifunctional riboflavin kinase/FAD synthetase [Deltaproteobacteria bacterium]|nr:bifunctional riboflavin kinase/FAD synthetase [Deltaproteobacteria bacterium]